MAKKGPLYAEFFLDRERAKGRRFGDEQIRSLHDQYEGIYCHPDGKRFIAVANVPTITAQGKTVYRKPEKTCSTLTEAKQWLEEKRSNGRKQRSRGVVHNPTLEEIILLTNAQKERCSSWRAIKRYRELMLAYFGEKKKLLSIELEDFLSYQSWLLARPREGWHPHKGVVERSGNLSPTTVDKHCKELNWLFKEARRRNMISQEIQFPLLGETGHRPFHISLSDFLLCLEFLPQYRAMLLMALNTGGRLSDVFHMGEDRISTRTVQTDQREGLSKRMRETMKEEMKEGVKEGLKKDDHEDDDHQFTTQTFISIRSSKTKKDNIEVPMMSETETALQEHQAQQERWLNDLFVSLTTKQPNAHDLMMRARYERALQFNEERRKKARASKSPYKKPIPNLKPREQVRSIHDLNPSGYLFLNSINLHPFTDIQEALDTAIKKAGIKRFTIHTIRHLSTTVLLDLTGGDVHLVQRIVGWSDHTMIQVYGHLGHRHIKTFATFGALVKKTKNSFGPEKQARIRGSQQKNKQQRRDDRSHGRNEDRRTRPPQERRNQRRATTQIPTESQTPMTRESP